MISDWQTKDDCVIVKSMRGTSCQISGTTGAEFKLNKCLGPMFFKNSYRKLTSFTGLKFKKPELVLVKVYK